MSVFLVVNVKNHIVKNNNWSGIKKISATLTNIATMPKRYSFTANFAERFSIVESRVMEILKAAAFKQGNKPATAPDFFLTNSFCCLKFRQIFRIVMAFYFEVQREA